MSVSLWFVPDPGGQQLEAVATEPADAVRSDAGSEWATVLEGRGWSAVWVPPRPVTGRVSLVGRLVVDRSVMVGPTVRGRVSAVDSLPGEDLCRVSLEVDPLRPRFLPGSMTWSQGKLWVLDEKLPVVRTACGEEHLLDLNVQPRMITSDRRGPLLKEDGAVRRLCDDFRFVARGEQLTCGPLGTLEWSDREHPAKLHLWDGGWLDRALSPEEFTDVSVTAVPDGFAVLSRLTSPAFLGHETSGIDYCLSFIGRERRGPRYFSLSEPVDGDWSVSPDMSRLIGGRNLVRFEAASSPVERLEVSVSGFVGDRIWSVDSDRELSISGTVEGIPVSTMHPEVLCDDSSGDIWVCDGSLRRIGPDGGISDVDLNSERH